MNLIQTLEQEEIARLGKTIPEFAPGDTVVVSVNVVQPNDPDQATGARLRPGIAWGPVVQDWRCRRDHPDAYRGRQKVEVEAAWRCAKPFD